MDGDHHHYLDRVCITAKTVDGSRHGQCCTAVHLLGTRCVVDPACDDPRCLVIRVW